MGIIDSFGDVIVLLYLTLYVKNLIPILFNKNFKQNLINKNTRLDELRNKKDKTLEEQKEFLKIKDPLIYNFNFTLKGFILSILQFTVIATIIKFILSNLSITFTFFSGLLFITIFSIISEMILKKFKLENTDLIEMLKI